MPVPENRRTAADEYDDAVKVFRLVLLEYSFHEIAELLELDVDEVRRISAEIHVRFTNILHVDKTALLVAEVVWAAFSGVSTPSRIPPASKILQWAAPPVLNLDLLNDLGTQWAEKLLGQTASLKLSHHWPEVPPGVFDKAVRAVFLFELLLELRPVDSQDFSRVQLTDFAVYAAAIFFCLNSERHLMCQPPARFPLNLADPYLVEPELEHTRLKLLGHLLELYLSGENPDGFVSEVHNE